MQSLRTYRSPRRAISIEALLVWTFRAQRAELEPPRDHDRDRPAVGTEWIIFQRGAVLGCTIDCSRRVLPDRIHDDAETVAAVVVGALDWHMATRVAELARAGRRPACITGPVRCTAAEWQENQHARWPVVAPALPARFPGGVWRRAMKDRKGRERYEGYCTPVTYDPTPQQVAASQRDYLAWWAAIHEVREACSPLRSCATTSSPWPCRRCLRVPKVGIGSSAFFKCRPCSLTPFCEKGVRENLLFSTEFATCPPPSVWNGGLRPWNPEAQPAAGAKEMRVTFNTADGSS